MSITYGLRRGIENGLQSPLGLWWPLLRAAEDVDNRVEANSEKLLVGAVSGSATHLLNLTPQPCCSHRCHLPLT